MQKQILEQHPDLDVAVYAVWFSMVATDERRRWPRHLLADPRVRHYWDEEKRVGRWFGRHPDFGDDPELVIWDTYFLFPAAARWTDTVAPLTSWGYTIVEHREGLRRDLLALTSPTRRPTRPQGGRPGG